MKNVSSDAKAHKFFQDTSFYDSALILMTICWCHTLWHMIQLPWQLFTVFLSV